MIYYIYNGDELLGFIYNSNTYYYHKNIFGDIIGILDSNYNEVVTYTYNSWGLLTNKTDTTTINLSTINPFRYRSYYYDEETNLYYLNSRYYNPEWGRFVNADENIGSEDKILSYNNFQYTFNNPINFIDDGGEWPKWIKESIKKVAIGTAIIAVTAVASVATGGAALPVIAAGLKTAVAIGTISAATSATISVGESILTGDDFKTTTKKAVQASVEGFANGFLAGSVSSSISSLSVIRGNGIKIGKTQNNKYGRATLWYGDKKGGTLFSISDKNGISKFRIDFDKNHGPHVHYKTETHGIRREDVKAYKKMCGIIVGVVERIFNLFK